MKIKKMTNKTAKVTQIDKKYKDKKTGEYKTITIQYSKVKDRLKEFWEANPNGKIETTPSNMNGQLMFKAWVVADKSNMAASKEATGHAVSTTDGEKDFEKLETIAVGRALALLGYASDGEIASGDEMAEFLEYQENKRVEMVFEAQSKLEAVKNLDELKTVWASLPSVAKNELLKVKDELKNKFIKIDESK